MSIKILYFILDLQFKKLIFVFYIIMFNITLYLK